MFFETSRITECIYIYIWFWYINVCYSDTDCILQYVSIRMESKIWLCSPRTSRFAWNYGSIPSSGCNFPSAEWLGRYLQFVDGYLLGCQFPLLQKDVSESCESVMVEIKRSRTFSNDLGSVSVGINPRYLSFGPQVRSGGDVTNMLLVPQQSNADTIQISRPYRRTTVFHTISVLFAPESKSRIATLKILMDSKGKEPM